MKKIISLMFIVVLVLSFGLISTEKAEAKTTYRSAKTGRYTTKSYSTYHPSTTYRSRR